MATTADLEVVGEAGSVRDALRWLRSNRADVVVTDLSLPDGPGGLELVKAIAAANAEQRVLVLSMHEEGLYAERAIAAGGAVTIVAHQRPDRLELSVHDRGDGVPDAYVGDIWSPGFTTKLGHASGMGLPLARALAESHGAELNLNRGPGAGAVFTLSLPLAASA